MFVCVRCALIAFVLGILGVVFVWPFLQDWWSGSGSGNYSAYDNGYGDNGDYGYGGGNSYGGYGGYRGGAAYGRWGGPPAYAVSAPRPRFVPPPCYRPCY